MDVYKTEEEQVEAIKKWWSENGKSIIAGIIIGIAAIFGWRGYENHTAMQAKAASMLYEQLLVASRKMMLTICVDLLIVLLLIMDLAHMQSFQN